MTRVRSVLNRLLVLALLGGIMFTLHELQATLRMDQVDALTFAALGFVVLAAFVLAELAGGLGVPRVTGYILAGIAVGPYAAGVLSEDVVVNLRVFETLALALIALEAGLELDLKAIRRLSKTLGSIILFKVPLSWLVMGGTFLALTPWLPLADGLSFGEKLSIGLIIGALSVGTSPAVSVAVISEFKAKGKLPDIVLALAVFKDVVMIVMLALALAATNVLITEGATLDAGVLAELAMKIGKSVAAGAVLGGLLIVFMRWVRWELVLSLILISYGGAELCDRWHLKMLLVFISAGFTVKNFSPYGHDLHKPLAFLALPVFIVFFTGVGADLDLTAVAAIAPFAGLLFLARAGMMYGATRLGCRLAGESRAFADTLWMGFISQAGVALGLLIVAREQLPTELGDKLGQIATVLIAMNLLVGPFLLRRSLGFVEPEAEGATTGATAAPPGPRPTLEPPELDAVVADVEAHLEELDAIVNDEVLQPWREAGRVRIEAMAQASAGQLAAELVPTPIGASTRRIRELARALRTRLVQIPARIDGDFDDDQWTPSRMRVPAMLHRVRRALGARTRRVPAQTLARARIEGRIIPDLVELTVAMAQAEAARIDRLGELASWIVAHPQEDRGPRLDAERMALTAAADGLSAWLAHSRGRAVHQLAEALAAADTPQLPLRRTRYGEVARSVDHALRRLDGDGGAWDHSLEGVAGRARIRTALAALELGFEREAAGALQSWRDSLFETMAASVVPVADRLHAVASDIRQSAAAMGRARLIERLEREMDGLDDMVRETALPCVDALRRGDEQTILGSVLDRLVPYTASLPETVVAIPRWVDATQLRDPRAVSAAPIAVQEIARTHLEGELAWGLSDAHRDAQHLVDVMAQRLGEVAGIVSYGLRAALSEVEKTPDVGPFSPSGDVLDLACGSLERAHRIVDALHLELTAGAAEISAGVVSETRDAVRHIERDTIGDETGDRGTARIASLRRSLTSVSDGIRAGLGSVKQLPSRALRSVLTSEMAHDIRVRRGLYRPDPREIAADVRAVAVQAEQRAKVPFVLAKLFDSSTLDTPHFPVGADPQINSLHGALDRYLEGRPTAVLMTGDEGVGKSSIARLALRNRAAAELIVVDLDSLARTETGFCAAVGAAAGAFSAKNFVELQRALMDGQRVILLDDLEHVFTRTTAGLAHIRRILALIGATRERVCWVVSIVGPTAQLLDRACGLRSWFTDHIGFAALTPATLGSVIDARCKLSGFHVAWPSPRDRYPGPWGAALSLFSGRTVDARRRWFYRELAAESGGNIRDALAQWLNAVETVDGDTLLLRPIRPRALPWFDQLGRDAHRVLGLLTVCGTLNQREAVEALHWTAERTRAALLLLEGTGLVDRDSDADDRLRVWPPVWRRVKRRLVKRRILALPEGGA